MTNKSMKRIHRVTIKRMYDESPDTSWLGEYSDRQASEYSIDRAHDLDCIANTGYASPDTECRNCGLAQKQHETVWFETVPQLRCFVAEDMHDEQETFTPVDCDCGRGEWNHREYRYFNPSPNYVNDRGDLVEGNTADEVRKYVRQDYERMESLSRGDWCFVGIRADAEYSVGGPYAPIQEITSGGVWGFESDMGEDEFKSEEENALDELKAQLKGIGFSARAIAAAFKHVEEGGDAR